MPLTPFPENIVKNSHYTINQTFAPFNPNLISSTQLKGRLLNSETALPNEVYTVYTYDGVPVHCDTLQFAIVIPTGPFKDTGRALSEPQRISLWQQVYLSTRESHDPKEIAQAYCIRQNICPVCAGDGHVSLIKDGVKTYPICYACSGTGKYTNYSEEE